MQFEEAGQFIMHKLATELPDNLTYHCTDHTIDVYNAAQAIAKSEGVDGHDLQLLLTAAWFHDAGFIISATNHEEGSCGIARHFLPAFGYTNTDIESICGMIMATRIPQSPANLLEQIIADADLDYLGRDDFFMIGDKLYEELTIAGVVANETDWNNLQVRFLQSHHYFTQTAIASRQAKKEQHLQQIKAKLAP
ncbi:MAG: HD domain-containing protein [Sphingobacteriales bacterium]|nr:MAG: HD domain-containing protein [Sphingobacteriales bacterium]